MIHMIVPWSFSVPDRYMIVMLWELFELLVIVTEQVPLRLSSFPEPISPASFQVRDSVLVDVQASSSDFLSSLWGHFSRLYSVRFLLVFRFLDRF